MTDFNHFNADGDAHMVDVGGKADTRRRAIATGRIQMQAATLEKIVAGDHKKGDVLAVARIAGIMAAKRTADLVPLCHPLMLSHVDVELQCDTKTSCVNCTVTVETTGKTGVEMEALTATQVCLLTIYDMCKAVDRGMCMTDIRLLEKSGGKSGLWRSQT